MVGQSGNSSGTYRGEALLLSEVDGAGDFILIDKLNSVGAAGKGRKGGQDNGE